MQNGLRRIEIDVQKVAEEHQIFYTRAGSRAYGLNTEGSDEDFRGVFVGLPDNLVGLHPRVIQFSGMRV